VGAGGCRREAGPKLNQRVHGKEIPAGVGTSSAATCGVGVQVERLRSNRWG